jgi:phage shock protein E
MNIKFVVLFIVIAIYYVYKTWEKFVFGSKYLISTIKAKKLIKDKYFNHIIDVRTNFEYNLGHYKNAINIPISEIAKKINSYKINKNKKILVYCNTGNRARQATEILINKGYKNINYISGSHLTLK